MQGFWVIFCKKPCTFCCYIPLYPFWDNGFGVAEYPLITNLDSMEFPPPALQALYAKRWGIETSFRELKYAVGLIHLHSRKSDLVLQEIFAAFTIFNFPQDAVWNVDEGWGRSKYERRVNFSHAVYLCCKALRRKAGEITGLLERTLRP